MCILIASPAKTWKQASSTDISKTHRALRLENLRSLYTRPSSQENTKWKRSLVSRKCTSPKWIALTLHTCMCEENMSTNKTMHTYHKHFAKARRHRSLVHLWSVSKHVEQQAKWDNTRKTLSKHSTFPVVQCKVHNERHNEHKIKLYYSATIRLHFFNFFVSRLLASRIHGS